LAGEKLPARLISPPAHPAKTLITSAKTARPDIIATILGQLQGLGGRGPSGFPARRLTALPSALKRSDMARMVQCAKLGRESEGLDRPPLKGELGQRIFDSISKEAWRMWLEHSKMLINEYRLDLTSEQGQKIWMDELEKFFFGEGSQLPPDYVPQRTK
jgi:Fe-S cluster biosynthesis and repair protein YggX